MRLGRDDVAASPRAVVQVVVEGAEGVAHREVPSSEFEPGERGLSMGAVLVPWARVFRYDVLMHQPLGHDLEDAGSRAVQRVVYEDEDGRHRTIEVPFDRFENGAWAVTMIVERQVLADRGELRVRKVSIPWHRIVQVERIFAVPEARPDR